MFVHLGLISLVLLASPESSKKPGAQAAGAAARLVSRSLPLEPGSSSVPTIRVAPGITTTLVFPSALSASAVTLMDSRGLFVPPKSAGRSLFLTPKKDPGAAITTLSVALEDGRPAVFQVVSAGSTGPVDFMVDVPGLASSRPASDSSAVSCEMSTAQLRQQLDQCESSTGTAGLRKVATLILEQDVSGAPAFVVEHHPVDRLDKDNGLYVVARHVYRLFEHSYLVVTVENRDPKRTWIMDKAQLRATGAGADLPIVAALTEVKALPPSETEKIVLIFATPPKRSNAPVTLVLTERGGTRHIKLEGIDL